MKREKAERMSWYLVIQSLIALVDSDSEGFPVTSVEGSFLCLVSMGGTLNFLGLTESEFEPPVKQPGSLNLLCRSGVSMK